MSQKKPPVPGPDDAECARLAQQAAHGTPEERQAAWERLQPVVERMAKRVARTKCFAKQAAYDFIDEASAHVWRALASFNPAHGSFRGFVYQVLCNLAIDRGRRAASEHTGIREADEEKGNCLEVPDPRAENPLDLLIASEELSPRQLRGFEQMPLMRRVIVVALAGLPSRLPQGIWAQWLQAAGIQPPFPPPEIYGFDKPTKRVRCVAEALAMAPEAVRQHWYRARDALQKILRDLSP